MNVDEIRKIVGKRPFRPIEIELDSGTTLVVHSPEIIITPEVVVTVNRAGEAVYIAPEAVSSIRQLARRHPKK